MISLSKSFICIYIMAAGVRVLSWRSHQSFRINRVAGVMRWRTRCGGGGYECGFVFVPYLCVYNIRATKGLQRGVTGSHICWAADRQSGDISIICVCNIRGKDKQSGRSNALDRKSVV